MSKLPITISLSITEESMKNVEHWQGEIRRTLAKLKDLADNPPEIEIDIRSEKQ